MLEGIAGIGKADMTNSADANRFDDLYDLSRFVQAQRDDFEQALSEIKNGKKRTHWMWYIFPQIEGLGSSPTARHYSIKSLEEAKAYLDHPILGARLRVCAEAVLRVEGQSASQILGSPDDLKLRSSATLFACVSPPGSVFERVLEKYYEGKRDQATLRLLPIDR
jgi:uncharacterized protein (DUF1810 family)